MRNSLILFWHNNYGTPDECFSFYTQIQAGASLTDALTNLCWTPEKIAVFMEQLQEIEQILKLYRIKNINLMTIVDENYPCSLLNMAVPPTVFVYKGQANWFKYKTLAVWGNDQLSLSGDRIFNEYILALEDIIYVGGLFSKLSCSVFEKVIYQNKRGLCILKTPFEQYNPMKHIFLQKRLEQNHLVISECPLQNKACETSIQRLVELIIGFSSCCCVIETNRFGLSMLAAFETVKQSKEVIVPPVSLFQEYGEGNNVLLEYGAMLLRQQEDIKDCLMRSRF